MADKFGLIADVSDDSDELKLSLMVSLVTWRRMKRWRYTWRYFNGYCKRQSRQLGLEQCQEFQNLSMMVMRDSRNMMQDSSNIVGHVRKEGGWKTNLLDFAAKIEGICSIQMGER